jgi:hypothetical protein
MVKGVVTCEAELALLITAFVVADAEWVGNVYITALVDATWLQTLIHR